MNIRSNKYHLFGGKITLDTIMSIEVEFIKNSFCATAIIEPDKLLDVKSFTFILNNNLFISEVMCNGKKSKYDRISEEKPSFRPLSQKIRLRSNETIKSIVIKYNGSVSFSVENRCWYNIITSDIISLSWYSVWFPQETSINIDHDKVYLLNGSNYFLVKGVYDNERNI